MYVFWILHWPLLPRFSITSTLLVGVWFFIFKIYETVLVTAPIKFQNLKNVQRNFSFVFFVARVRWSGLFRCCIVHLACTIVCLLDCLIFFNFDIVCVISLLPYFLQCFCALLHYFFLSWIGYFAVISAAQVLSPCSWFRLRKFYFLQLVPVVRVVSFCSWFLAA